MTDVEQFLWNDSRRLFWLWYQLTDEDLMPNPAKPVKKEVNAIENKGNTPDKQPSFPLPNRFSSEISPIMATPAGIKRATHAYRRSIQ
jgi:hypothetical protein